MIQNSFIALPGKGGHSRLMPPKPCPPSRGLIGLAQKTGLWIRIRVSAFFSLQRSFKVIKAGVWWSGDGFWWSSRLLHLDLHSGMEMAYKGQEGVRKCFKGKATPGAR